MIKFCNDKYRAARDLYGWTLFEAYDIAGKDGTAKIGWRQTYHANLLQVCNAMIDMAAGKCESLEQLIELLTDTQALVDTAERNDGTPLHS